MQLCFSRRVLFHCASRLLFGVVIMTFSHQVLAQQSLFNVPSSQITKVGKDFLQVQQNSSTLQQTNLTYNTGLGRSTEVGINVFNVNTSNSPHSFRLKPPTSLNVDAPGPLVLVNAQTAYALPQSMHVAYGFQFGQGRTLNQHPGMAVNQYVNVTKSFLNDGLLVLGYYKENRQYAGPGKAFGLMEGIDCPINHRLHFVADSISGTTAGAQQVIGFTYAAHEQTILSVGLSKTTVGHRFSGLVFEYTLQ